MMSFLKCHVQGLGFDYLFAGKHLLPLSCTDSGETIAMLGECHKLMYTADGWCTSTSLTHTHHAVQ